MGFERQLRSIGNGHVNRKATATTLLFLTALRYSCLSKPPYLAPALFRDTWTPIQIQNNQFESSISSSSSLALDDICEGVGINDMMEKFGFAWWKPKIDWSCWQLADTFANHFFTNQPEFLRRYRRRHQQVLRVHEATVIYGLIEEWLTTRPKHPQIVDAIFDFAIGFIALEFRRDIWSQMTSTKSIQNLTPELKYQLESGAIPLTFSNVGKYGADGPIELQVSNKVFHKQKAQVLLDYILGFQPFFDPSGRPKERASWANKPCRLAYRQIYNLLSQHLSSSAVDTWKRRLFYVIHAINPLLPIPDKQTFIQRRKGKQNYVWSGWQWSDGLGPRDKAVTAREIVEYSYRRGDDSVFFTLDCPFDGTPPYLEYQDEFHGQPISKIQKRMQRKLKQIETSIESEK